jgi:hypothetical protein
MIFFRKILAIVMLVAGGTYSVYATEPDWEFIREQGSIRLYRRDVPGTEIEEFKGEAVIDARIDVIGMALRDVPAYPTWMPDCKQIRFVEKFDEDNFILYQIQNAPWPVLDRDAVVKVSTIIDWEAGRFTVTLQDIEDPRVPPVPNLVRLAHLNGQWYVEYLDRGHSRVTYIFTADPAGALPVNMVNANLQKAPYTTLQGLRRIVRDPIYIEAANQSPDRQRLERFVRLNALDSSNRFRWTPTLEIEFIQAFPSLRSRE